LETGAGPKTHRWTEVHDSDIKKGGFSIKGEE